MIEDSYFQIRLYSKHVIIVFILFYSLKKPRKFLRVPINLNSFGYLIKAHFKTCKKVMYEMYNHYCNKCIPDIMNSIRKLTEYKIIVFVNKALKYD